MVVLVGALWERPTFIWSAPPLWMPAVAVAVIAIGRRRMPLIVALWWVLGLASLAWTLTPGSTLVAILWSVMYLAVWRLGRRPALMLAVLWVLLQGVVSGLSLQIFGMEQYFSGSVGYLSGAAALLLLPWSFHLVVTSSRLLVRLVALSASVVAVYAALASGSRGVYLGFALVVIALLSRLMSRRGTWRAALIAAMIVVALVATADVFVPGRPITSALGLKARASVAAVSSAAPPVARPGNPQQDGGTVSASRPPKDENAIASRLKMWDQTARIGLTHPFGTGLGSFRDTIAAFQRYPSVNFASAHNVLLEVFATEGWPGLLLLLFVLVSSIWRGWRSRERWPFAVGAAGLWLTMCFDITWSMPVMPLLGFWALSASHGPSTQEVPSQPASRGYRRLPVSALAVIVLAVPLMFWWYLPCGGSRCVLARHRGFRPEATRVVSDSSQSDRSEVLRKLRSLYPKSLWVLSLARSTARTSEERLAHDRDIVREFPLAGPSVYLELARLQLGEGDAAAARATLLAGLGVFPPSLSPAGVPLVSRSAEYKAWIEQAHALQAQLGP